MHLINAQYRILDVFEKNPLQSLMLGSSIENPDDIVVINEVIWSPLFTRELIQSLFSGFINLKTHSEDAVSCQLVTAYHKGMPIANYLSSRVLPFRNRFNLCYEFLKAMVSYDAFPPWIQDILIDEDQIIVWEDQLLYNELLILKTGEVEYADRIPFSKVKKKIHKVIGKLIGNSQDASPALLSFLERLSSNAAELSSLKAIYDDFQKVYLYDYYLDKDDTAPPVATIFPVLIPLPIETEDIPEQEPEDAVPPEPESTEPENPQVEDEAEGIILPVLPIPELDAVDSDMEKNLDLFFNRDRQQAEQREDSDDTQEKNRNWLWIALGVACLMLMIWAAVYAFSSRGNPVAAFTSTQEESIWTLQNKSTFSDRSSIKRSEWTVSQNGKVIGFYNTKNLTLPLEEEGIYQVVLKVMDSDGKWSKPIKADLKNILTTAGSVEDAAKEVPTASPISSGEKMDQFTLKFNPERTQKDVAFFRTGNYSLQISPGKNPEIIEVQGVLLDKNGMVSIWISSEKTSAITLAFTGYNQNTEVSFNELTRNPISPGQWEMVQFTVAADKLVNRMTLSVKTDALIHLDDLNIDSYK